MTVNTRQTRLARRITPPARMHLDHPATFEGPTWSAEDLGRLWRALLGPLVFDEPQIWLCFPDPALRRPGPLLRVLEAPHARDHGGVVDVVTACRTLLPGVDHDGPVALLRGRPGPARLTGADRRWGALVHSRARRSGLPVPSLVLVADGTLTPLSPEELRASPSCSDAA